MDWTPSVDLVILAQNHIAFLNTVHKTTFLHEPAFIKNAIRRYEYMWLPLVSKNHLLELEPPIDIHWIWHCHMLAPRAYASDCQSVTGTVVDHKFRITKSANDEARSNAIQIWNRWFPDEPFDVDFNAPLPKENLEPKTTMIRYDILAATSRQRSFYYHISLPHFTDTKFLMSAVKRYVKFLQLKKSHPQTFLGKRFYCLENLMLFVLFYE